MLKIRIIPILTFNGFALIKTKQFANPRMVGNPVQSARVFNSRGVDELAFIDIFAKKQNRKLNLDLVKQVINECYMPVAIGGAIETLDDITDLLKIGADKVIIKSAAIQNINFVNQAADFFGSQCITVAVDAIEQNGQYFIQNNESKTILLTDFIQEVEKNKAGELVVTAVNKEGMMAGFDIELAKQVEKMTSLPIIMNGGAGNMAHFEELFTNSEIEAVAASSLFYFTQFTPLDIKKTLQTIGKSVRI